MEEKYMVNDVLQNSIDFVKLLNDTILECTNSEFKQMIISIRNSSESFIGELNKIAELKGYYVSSPKVNESEIVLVKKMFM